MFAWLRRKRYQRLKTAVPEVEASISDIDRPGPEMALVPVKNRFLGVLWRLDRIELTAGERDLARREALRRARECGYTPVRTLENADADYLPEFGPARLFRDGRVGPPEMRVERVVVRRRRRK